MGSEVQCKGTGRWTGGGERLWCPGMVLGLPHLVLGAGQLICIAQLVCNPICPAQELIGNWQKLRLNWRLLVNLVVLEKEETLRGWFEMLLSFWQSCHWWKEAQHHLVRVTAWLMPYDLQTFQIAHTAELFPENPPDGIDGHSWFSLFLYLKDRG